MPKMMMAGQPLHYASTLNDNAQVIKELIKAGADVHAKNKYGSTPLHGAAGRQ